jgi:hypothetical protein
MIQLSEQEFIELAMRAAYRVMQDVYHEHRNEIEEMQDYVDALSSQKVELERRLCDQNANDTDDRWPHGHNVTALRLRKVWFLPAVWR